MPVSKFYYNFFEDLPVEMITSSDINNAINTILIILYKADEIIPDYEDCLRLFVDIFDFACDQLDCRVNPAYSLKSHWFKVFTSS